MKIKSVMIKCSKPARFQHPLDPDENPAFFVAHTDRFFHRKILINLFNFKRIRSFLTL